MRILVLALVVAILTACAGTEMAYEGERLPPDQVSTLSVAGGGKINVLDGRELGGRKYEILPGEHVAQIDFVVRGTEIHSGAGERFWFVCTLRFTAKPGLAYRAKRTKLQRRATPAGERTQRSYYGHEPYLQIGAGNDRDESAEFICHGYRTS